MRSLRAPERTPHRTATPVLPFHFPHPTVMTPLSLRPLALLAALALAPAVATAQAAPETPALAPDPTLARYAGTWDIAIASTPIGTVTGTLTVAKDGTGTLSIAEMGVESAAVTGASGKTGALVAASAFHSPVAEREFTCTITLTPAEDGTLAGMIDAGMGGAFEMTARRAAP